MPDGVQVEQIALNAFHEQENWFAAMPERQFAGRKAVLLAAFAGNVADPDLLSWLPDLQPDNSAARLLDTPDLHQAVLNVLDVVAQGDPTIETRFAEKWQRLDNGADMPRDDASGQRAQAVRDLHKTGAAKGWRITGFQRDASPAKPSFPFQIHLN